MRNKYNAKFYEGSTDHDTKYTNKEYNKQKSNKNFYETDESISEVEISNEFDDHNKDYKSTLEYGQKYYQSAKEGNQHNNNH